MFRWARREKRSDAHVLPALAFDTATHRVYAPEQEEDGRPVARMIVYEPVGQRPPTTLKEDQCVHTLNPVFMLVLGLRAAE